MSHPFLASSWVFPRSRSPLHPGSWSQPPLHFLSSPPLWGIPINTPSPSLALYRPPLVTLPRMGHESSQSAFHQARWLTSVNPRTLKQEDQEFKASLGCLKPFLKNRTKERKTFQKNHPVSLLLSLLIFNLQQYPLEVSSYPSPRAWLSLPVPDLRWHCLPTNCIFI